MTIEEFQAVIDAKDRSAAGKSAPACGLYLAAIEYPENTWKGEGKGFKNHNFSG